MRVGSVLRCGRTGFEAVDANGTVDDGLAGQTSVGNASLVPGCSAWASNGVGAACALLQGSEIFGQ